MVLHIHIHFLILFYQHIQKVITIAIISSDTFFIIIIIIFFFYIERVLAKGQQKYVKKNIRMGISRC